ncbi:MAG: hypothetical protein KJZ65_09760 [Phycisphaerales bacterium]|nr:hypothetical protein [Phycisphaerales bacterium]
MQERLNRIAGLGLLAACGLAVSHASGGTLVTLYTENWEGFTLYPNIEEGILTGPAQNVAQAFFGDAIDATPFNGTWTANGWTQTFSPAGVGTAEWEGWSVANREFWVNSAFQLREEFTKAQGAVAVADPDEWDDYDPVLSDPESAGFYETTLTSPIIPLGGTTENTVVLTFDSSWRPEDNQQVRLSVRFNGGGWQEILYWNSFEGDPNYHPDATNETVSININNPAGAADMQLRWEMFEAGNDWWWAIDNIVVAGEGGDPVNPPTPFNLTADTFNPNTTPTISWTQSINATGYEVQFANDSAYADLDLAVLLDADTRTYTPDAGILNPGVYYVRVIARNTVGTAQAAKIIGLDASCQADLNADGVKNFFDVQRFLGQFSRGCD